MYGLYAFADEAGKDFGAQIAAMTRNGLQGLEIRGVDGENVSAISLEKAKELRLQMEDAGLITWSIGSPVGKVKPEDDFESHLDVLRHCLEVADILGARNLRLFSFFMKPEEVAGYRNLVMDRMGAFLEVAKGSGVALCHENEKGIYGATAECCLDLLTEYPELRGIFDPANFVQCGVDTTKAWALLRERTYYLHIKDALPDGRVVPAGKGRGNVAVIVKDYLSRGGCAMTLEPHLKVFDGLKALEQAGEESKIGAYRYSSSDAAFDAACTALKEILGEVAQ